MDSDGKRAVDLIGWKANLLNAAPFLVIFGGFLLIHVLEVWMKENTDRSYLLTALYAIPDYLLRKIK